MDTQSWYQVQEFAPQTYAICEAGRFYCYLAVGSQQALLIDCGLGIADLHRLVMSITSLPAQVVLTHTHWDHRGCAYQFPQVRVHPLEAAVVDIEDAVEPRRWLGSIAAGALPWPAGFDPASYCIRPAAVGAPLRHGEVIDLGDRMFRVYHTPGHTPGGVTLLDVPNGILVAGDLVKPQQPLYAHLPGADSRDYLRSLEQLAALAPQVRLICSGHSEPYGDASILADMAQGFRQVLQGACSPTPVESRWGQVNECRFPRFAIWTRSDTITL